MRSQPIHHRAPPLRAAIYGPAREIGRWQPTCTAWSTECGYELVSIIDETPDAARWSDLLHAMADGLADLPPNRMARVETIGRRQPTRRPGLRAVVYGPPWDVTRWGHRGVSWCQQGELTICGLVVETPDAHEWPAVVREMATGAVDVVVMGSWGHLPPHRLPRVEVAGTSPPGLLQPRVAKWYRHRR
ncbi:hypothetical protein HCB17_25015 [Salinispora arenicola]|uniref:hypothetical protein n=1 Tax=Salinispora arenicola TaxID=168697 RepID=UPI0014300371|nr:hypothetical protein [Salinispora arenicola]NIL44011.1 hypothetical protein [Salinispora arenicola]